MEGNPSVVIGKKLSKARTRAGLTHEALAAEMQAAGLPISASRLASIEEGLRLPDTDVAAALAATLGLDLAGFDLPHPKTHVPIRAIPSTGPREEEAKSSVEVPSRAVSQAAPRPARPSPAPPPAEPPEPPGPTERARARMRGTKVADYPRLTVYLDPGTKALIEGASSVLGTPVYRLLTAAFRAYHAGLSEEDRNLIEKVAAKRKGG